MNRTFINSLFVSIIISLGSISATNYYVDKNASGNNNGSSWNDAWTSFSSINWGQINPGDILYISGGSSSKVYSEQLSVNASGTSGNNILITKGISPGHNGKVILDGGRSLSHNISLQGVKYVTVQYMTVRGSTGSGNVDIDGCTGLVIDSLDIYADSGHGGISIKTSSGVHLQRNYITTPANTSDQTDGIYSQKNTGKNYYHDNYIIISNSNSSPHCDGIQSYKDKDLDIYNNYVEQDNSKSSNAQGIYLTTPINGSTIRFWNNIVNHGQSNSNGLAVRNLGSTGITVSMIGNTVYGETGSDHSIWMTEMTSAPTVKNNIIHFVGTTGTGISITGAGYNNTSYNLQSNTANVRGSNAITSDPLFTNPSNRDFTLLAGSPAIDAGTALGSPYNVDKNGSPRPLGNGWDMGAYENYSGPDVTPPQLQSATINNPTQIVLFFSESLDAQSAQDQNNYSIDNGISVLSAALSSNNRDVTLTTSEHSPNQQYTVTVNNVTDLAGNTIDPQANSAQYFFEVDTTPPQLFSAFAIVPTQVTLFFSEALDPQSAQNVSNYNINNGISIIDAVLNSNNTDVTLTTSAHDTNQTYTATVSNVTDLSGNVISPNNNSADYQLIILSGPVFPIDLFGTPESEKTVTFNLSLPGNMPDLLTYHMIAFDADHGGNDPPEGHAFINGNGPLELFPGATQANGDGQTNTFAFTLPSSWWVNGVNELRFVRLYSTGYRIDSAFISLDGSTDVKGEDNIPNDFTLDQNYPNPFNPTTNISFSLPVDSKVRLSVYNLLGEKIAELVNDEFSAGTHTFSFNADGLTSGIYFYRLEAGTFLATRKMILLR
ncbi:MAG: T9SS type A sorting domain-containing protein [Bacteroidetes bacterium]|nr:T9SS type A sorting domain-containing protein [Bacteroidota bacterium]